MSAADFTEAKLQFVLPVDEQTGHVPVGLLVGDELVRVRLAPCEASNVIRWLAEIMAGECSPRGPGLTEILRDERLTKLSPDDRWNYLQYITRLDDVKRHGAHAVLGMSAEEHYSWWQRLTVAGLMPRSFS
jgi:hypothetical protein